MAEFLVASAQALSLLALLYGAYTLISRGPQMRSVRKVRSRFDPSTTHQWSAPPGADRRDD